MTPLQWCSTLVLIILLIFIRPSSSADNEIHGRLTILPEGERARFEAHKTLLLTCQGVNVEPGYFSDFQWFDRNGERINSNQRIQLKQSQGSLSLIINDPDIGDSGNYRCTAMYQKTLTLNASIEIIVFKGITWDDCPEDQFLIMGEENQKIVCKVSSQPTSKIGWEKDHLELDKQRYSVTNDGVLIKGPVSNDTTGLYKITASILEHGILRTRNIRVQVLIKPSITEFAKYREVVEGEKTIIDCRATGTPMPFYSFLDHNRKNLTLEAGYIVDSLAGSLTMESVKKDLDQQQYIDCLAENVAGIASQRMDLKVLTRPFVFQFTNVSLPEGSNEQWSCFARGDPVPEVEIVKVSISRLQDRLAEKPLPEINSRYAFEVKSVGPNEIEYRMKFSPLARSDDGLYMCRAKNKAGFHEAIGHIQVEFPPDLSQTNTNVKTWSSNAVNLTCLAEAIPNATLSWRFGNEDIRRIEGESYAIYEGNGISHLLVKPNAGRHVYGSYFCTAENLRGVRTVEIKLTEAYKPSAPDVKIIKIRPTSIEVELSEVNPDLPIKNYIVKYWRESEADSEKQKVWPATGLLYKLEDLTPRTRYRLSFAAENDVGIGDFTPVRIEQTPAESRPEKPTFLLDGESEAKKLRIDGFIKSDFGDRYTVRWNQAEDNGRTVELYTLKYYKVHKTNDGYLANGESYPEVRISARDSLEYHFHSLTPNTFYRIELYAINAIGASDPSELVFKTSSTATSPSEWGQDLDYDSANYNMGTALISVAISLIIILILMDIIFYIRCKVGVLYFIKSFIWPETSVNNHKKAKSNEFHSGNLGSISEVKRSSRSEIDNPAFDSTNGKIKNDELTPMMSVTDTRGDIHERINQGGIRRPKDSAV